MEFGKTVMITLCARLRCKEQTFVLCGRRGECDDLREKH